jgi:hypothetical protein
VPGISTIYRQGSSWGRAGDRRRRQRSSPTPAALSVTLFRSPLALVLAGSGRGQESLAVSNLPSIALTPAHLTGWTGSLTRTPARALLCGVVLMPRAPLHANVDRRQRDCRPGLEPEGNARANFARMAVASKLALRKSLRERVEWASYDLHVRSRKAPP